MKFFSCNVGLIFFLLKLLERCILRNFFQRPSAKELLKHPFIRRAKKNSFLIDLIERSVEYKARLGPSSDSDQDEDADSSGGYADDISLIICDCIHVLISDV